MRDGARITIDDFGNGIDRRLGLVSRVANKFFDLENVVITEGRKLRRRPPLRNVTGQLSPNASGGFYINGRLVTVAPAGASVTHTTAVPATTVFFDSPPNATAEWRLIDLQAFNEQLVAIIAHRFDSTAAPWRTFLHVWDDARPTYVSDPAFPTTWTSELPQHLFGVGKVGAYFDYTPRMAISADRIYVSRPDGNVAYCGTGKPRIWNTRTAEEILVDGRWWYWISTNQPGDFTIDLDVPFLDLVSDQRFAAYVCEACLADGTWSQMREQTTITAYGDYTVQPIPNPFAPTDPPHTRLTIRFPGDGRVFRFRALAKAPVILTTGLYVTTDRTVVGGSLTHEGRGHLVNTYQTPVLPTAGDEYYIAAAVPDAPIPVPTTILGVPSSMPFNGQERYWSRILANVESGPGGATFLYALTGNVTITVNGTRVSGVGTLFRSELNIGRQVEINGERRNVRFIGSDVDMEVDAPFTTAYTGIGLRDPRYRYAYEIADAGNEWYAEQEADATFNNAGRDDAGALGTATYDSSGELPLSISVAQNRLLVQFSASLQLWGVGPNAVTDMRLLSKDGQSSGIQTAPRGVLIDGDTALPTANGVRLFSPNGLGKDYIRFIGIGDLLRGIPTPDLTRAIWWPNLRAYITCAASDPNGLTFFVLFKHVDTRVLGWNLWRFAGITAVDDLFIHQGDLCMRIGRDIKRVATADTTFRDDTDPADLPYRSRGRLTYCDLGTPQRNKKLTQCEVVQEGTCTLRVYMNPSAVTENAPGPPSVQGTTMGFQRVPLAVMGPGIAVEFESRDPAGHNLDSIAFDYVLRNR